MDKVAWVISTSEANMAEKNDQGAATAAAEKVSKGEAVEKTLAKLGGEAMPKEIRAEVKERFGLDVSTNYINSLKAEFKAGKGTAKKPSAKKPATSQAVTREK